MEQYEKGPICRRKPGKRHRCPSSNSHIHLQSSNDPDCEDGSKAVHKQILKPSKCQIPDEFEKFNESDLLFAEVDIEFLLSPSCESNITPSANKRQCSQVTQQNSNSKISRTDVLLTETTACPPDQNSVTSVLVDEDCNSDDELFDDIFDQLGGSDLGILINHCNIEENKNNKEASGSLSEYFILDRQEDNSVSENNLSSTKITHDIQLLTNTSLTETELGFLSIPITSSTLTASGDHSVAVLTNKESVKIVPEAKEQIANKAYVETEPEAKEVTANKACVTIETEAKEVASTIGKTCVVSYGSIRSRIKEQLQQNAKSPAAPPRNVEESLQAEAIKQAKLEASQIRKEGTKVDIGPFYGLPAKVQQLFETHRGVTKFYDWQNECLNLQPVKDHKNLIYTLPTSGGKTLVAEILIMRELLCYERDALLVLPFVSIVQEKVKTISEFATELGFIVEEYAGSKGRFPPIKRQKKKSLYIATIEKAHSLVNSLIETERTQSLGLVVVDEIHMIGEGGSRGATLEAMILKLILKFQVQIIGMSATLSNIKDLQEFLHAELFASDFRPVTLKEYVKVEDNVFSVNHQALDDDGKLEHERIITFPYSAELLKQDPDHLMGLVTEIIPDNSCLIFCATKKHCENVAVMLSKLIYTCQRHLAEVKKDKRRQLLKELYQDGEGTICPVLKTTVPFGIAYHHSGLTTDERRLIEDAYSEGTLCLLTCTSTLAAGVNLPAKRVILRSPYVGLSFIKHSQYKQMVGRAGRAGIDTSGESILIIKAQDKMKVKDLLAGPKDLCHSSLAYDGMKGIKSLLLSAIGLKIVNSVKSAYDLMSRSLLQIQSSTLDIDVVMATREALRYLVDQKLVICSRSEKAYDSETEDSLHVSSLGQATFKGSVDYTCSSQLYLDLKASKESLNIATYLHLLYLVTPYDISVNIDWRIYLNQFFKLKESELKVASLIEVPESYIGLKAAGHSMKKKSCEKAVNRFYLTLMLWDLWNLKSVWEIAERFAQPRGFVQNLLSQSVSFASCVFHFCQELEEFWAYQDLFANFIKRLSYCVSSELIPLMEVPGVKLARARQLYAAGFKSISILAGADISDLVKSIEHMSLRAARQIIAAAKNILEEKTAALLEEVESLVPVPHSTIGCTL